MPAPPSATPMWTATATPAWSATEVAATEPIARHMGGQCNRTTAHPTRTAPRSTWILSISRRGFRVRCWTIFLSVNRRVGRRGLETWRLYRYIVSLSIHRVSMSAIAYNSERAEAMEPNDRGPPPGGGRRDSGHHHGAGCQAWAAGGDDVADRREDRDWTSDPLQVLPRRRIDPARLARATHSRSSRAACRV